MNALFFHHWNVACMLQTLLKTPADSILVHELFKSNLENVNCIYSTKISWNSTQNYEQVNFVYFAIYYLSTIKSYFSVK